MTRPGRTGKAVYFAAGSPVEAAADLKRLGLCGPEDRLRVVAFPDAASQLMDLASLRAEQMLIFRPSVILGLWIRLWMFLGISHRSEIVFLKSPGRFRSLKLLALTLPGRLILSDGKSQPDSCSHWTLLKSTVMQAIAAEGPLCVIHSASPGRMKAIVANLRARYPHAEVFGVAPISVAGSAADLFDSFIPVHPSLIGAYLRLLPRCLGKKRFLEIILPVTNEGYSSLKWLAALLPFLRMEAYNENLDSFSARSPVSLNRHFWWRRRQQQLVRRQKREVDLAEREALHHSLPVGVIGSSSAFYLKTITTRVRASFPQAKLHGLLPQSLEEASRGLFDSTTILRPGLAGGWQFWKNSRMKVQCWIVPCTDEPYTRMKLGAFLFPLSPRHVYNELSDGFPARDLGTFYRHIAWRSRDHLSFQILARTVGGNLGARMFHLLIYSLRLLMGGAALLKVRLQSISGRSAGQAGTLSFSSTPQPSVDLIYLNSRGAADKPEFPVLGASAAKMKMALAVTSDFRRDDMVFEINAAIRQSQAQFICLLDSRCQMLNDDWLDRLLQTFDERTAQAGPELIAPSNGSVMQGALIGEDGEPRWNWDNAVCWLGRPGRLLVEAVPWACLVIRRSAFLQAGGFGDDFSGDSMQVEMDLCRRLSALGWNSICDRSVTAVFPLMPEAADLEPAGVSRASRRLEAGL